MLIHENDAIRRLWHLQNILAEKTQALITVQQERDRLLRENHALKAENKFYSDVLIRAALELGMFDAPEPTF